MEKTGRNPLFLIPARSGSKGIPGKNIRLLGGEPLIVHSIRAALETAGDPGDVVVSTDSEEIAAIAEAAGARIPFLRPAELATDTASSRDVILHAADTLGYDTVVLLQPTSPFRNIADIKKAVDLFFNPPENFQGKPDMAVSVKPASTNPYYNAYETAGDGRLVISKGDGLVTRRQDAPEVWEFDGSIYVIDSDSLRKHPSLARLPRILPVASTVEYNIDIDTELDFMLAEAVFSRLSGKVD